MLLPFVASLFSFLTQRLIHRAPRMPAEHKLQHSGLLQLPGQTDTETREATSVWSSSCLTDQSSGLSLCTRSVLVTNGYKQAFSTETTDERIISCERTRVPLHLQMAFKQNERIQPRRNVAEQSKKSMNHRVDRLNNYLIKIFSTLFKNSCAEQPPKFLFVLWQ